jgi:hypothetical protein
MTRFSCFFFTLFMIAQVSLTAADDMKLPKGWVCWPLHYSGIVLGITTDDQVKRLLGEGVYRKAEGDSGGRYYIDAKRSATLHVVGYTDAIIGEVTIEEGIDPKIQENECEKATSRWFSPDEGFGNYHALQLGSKKEEVIKNLGLPEKEIGPNELRYQSRSACEIEIYFTLFFREERLYKIVLSAPAG